MTPDLGAALQEDGRCRFHLWAPSAEYVDLQLLDPHSRIVRLERGVSGYHQTTIDGVKPGALYSFSLAGGPQRPDPASRFQPRGVHGPSAVVDPAGFEWSDRGWKGLALEQYVLYELHIGTFTREGTFDAAIPFLDELVDLGITAVEIMPVAQFPGARNWGYDGVLPYAVQESYGGPGGLKRLVDACHARGLAAVLDVVYNHLGPEGNYLAEFGPYFSPRYQTPWGPAINFDGPGSDEVRRYFVGNALYWIEEFHFDGLRLDAIHGILDLSARPFLAELADEVHRRAGELDRSVHVFAESDLNDVRVLRPTADGGYGHDAQWNDDHHHALHALLTGERDGYYADFGGLDALRTALDEGFVYSGQYSRYRGRRHGSSTRAIDPRRFVVFAQNHDQVGNRARGDRLSRSVSFEALKLAAGSVTLAPGLPLLFMGEEYGETAPFQYFVSHSDEALIDAVRRGRREEFAAFGWTGELPDPQDEATFLRCRLDRGLARQEPNRRLRALYAEMLRLRREKRALRASGRKSIDVLERTEEKAILLLRGEGAGRLLTVFHFGEGESRVSLPQPSDPWRRLLDSSERRWGGPGTKLPERLPAASEGSIRMNPQSLVLLERE